MTTISNVVADGGRFTGTDFFSVTNELAIEMPALKRPTFKELRKRYSIRSIEYDYSTEDPVVMRLATVLLPGEASIDGEEYERRLITKPGTVLGYQHEEWVVEHQDEYPALMAFLGKIYIDFSGIVVVDRRGIRSILSCGQRDSRWVGRWLLINGGGPYAKFYKTGRVAVAEQLVHRPSNA